MHANDSLSDDFQDKNRAAESAIERYLLANESNLIEDPRVWEYDGDLSVEPEVEFDNLQSNEESTNLMDDPGSTVKEIRIALVGRPNVGKSSFMNRLLGSSRSVVSDVAGSDFLLLFTSYSRNNC